MKKLFTLLVLALPLITNAQGKYQYVSPSAGSVMNNIETDIIIREGSFLKATSVSNHRFTIIGSKSGIHHFSFTICRDSKTILLHPEIPFSYDEVVTVAVSKGMQSTGNRRLNGYSFSFSTHREFSSEEFEGFKTGKEMLQQQETGQYNGVENQNDGGDTRDLEGLVTITDNTNPSPGDIFFDAFSAFFFGTKWTGYHVITSNGDSVYSVELSSPSDFKMEDNGNFDVREGLEPRFDELDSNFTIINKIYGANGYPADFHECQITPDHHVFIIADETQIIDMTVYSPNYSSHATVYGTVIQEFDPDGNLIFQWRSFDHIAPNEAQHINLASSFIDYIHTNSIDQDTDGNLIFSNRHLDQVDKIDLSTGEFMWRLGGMMNEFTFPNDAERFTFEHDARRIANGNLTLWDNGNYHIPSHSTAKEYQLDEINKVATLVWSYGHPGGVNGASLYNTAGGSVQRLSNGNTFINGGWRSNSSNPSMWEVTSDGTLVWEAKLTSSSSMTSYRAHRYEWNPCPRPTFKKLNTKDITSSSATLKWNGVTGVYQYKIQYKKHSSAVWTEKNATSDKHSKKITGLDADSKYDWRIETVCNAAGSKVSGYTEIKKFTTLVQRSSLNAESDLSISVFPNPAHDEISIQSNAVFNQVRIVDLMGREVKNAVCNTQHLNIAVGTLPSGNYLIIVTSNDQQQVEKIVIE